MSELRCYGCGNVLQSTNENEAGYVPTKILESRDHILCQRCFKLQHYNTNSEIQLVTEDFVNILKNVGKHSCSLYTGVIMLIIGFIRPPMSYIIISLAFLLLKVNIYFK